MARIKTKEHRSFKQQTAHMTRKEKLSYIYHYYRWHIVAAIAIPAMLISMVHASVTNAEPYLDITFASGVAETVLSMDDPMAFGGARTIIVGTALPGVLSEAILPPDAGRAEVQVRNFRIDFDTMIAFTTLLGAGAIDLLVTHSADMAVMADIGHFIPLSMLGVAIPDHMRYNDYAVYLRYFPIFDGHVAYDGDLLLGVAVGTRHPERVERFFDLLLASD